MTYNVLAYCIFFSLMFYIIGIVGWQFYKYGRHYLEDIFRTDPHLVPAINKLMLVGYYLINLGYVALSIQAWQPIQTLTNLFDTLSEKIGILMILLGGMHYLNLFWMSHFYRIKHFFKTI